MTLITTSIAAVLLLGILVTVHEFGHFLAAKAFGIAVPVFSIGWGSRAFGFRWRGTDFRVSWVPIGGYMRPAGGDPFSEGGALDPDGVPVEQHFMSKPAWQRAAVKAAGPAMNLALAFVLFAGLYFVGQPQPRAEVLEVLRESAAEKAGMLPLDRVVGVNGEPVTTWLDMREAFARAPSDPVVVEIERQGQRQTFTLDADAPRSPLDPFDFGLYPYTPDAEVVVDDPASPAGRAGIATGDRILSVGGVAVGNLPELNRAIAAASGATPVEFSHAGETRTTELVVAEWTDRATDADDTLWRRTGLASATLSIKAFTKATGAAKDAGLEPGDRVLLADGQIVRRWTDVPKAVSKATVGEGERQVASTVTLQVRRAGEVKDIAVSPEVVYDTDELGRYTWRALLGIEFGGDTVTPTEVMRSYPASEAALRGGQEVVGVASFIVERIGELVTRQAAPSKSLGGPIEMFSQAQQAAERGAGEWTHLMGLLSLSLGIMNLLPVPVFDGGDMLIYLAEAVRGRPLPRLLRERAQQVGIIFIAVLMVSVIVLDIHRRVFG